MTTLSPLAGYLLALGLTLAIEVPVVAALYPGRRRRLALVAVPANVVTHLALHFIFPRLLAPGAPALFLGEAFATLAEAAVYAVAGRDLGRALVASALANAASFGAGVLLWG